MLTLLKCFILMFANWTVSGFWLLIPMQDKNECQKKSFSWAWNSAFWPVLILALNLYLEKTEPLFHIHSHLDNKVCLHINLFLKDTLWVVILLAYCFQCSNSTGSSSFLAQKHVTNHWRHNICFLCSTWTLNRGSKQAQRIDLRRPIFCAICALGTFTNSISWYLYLNLGTFSLLIQKPWGMKWA